MVFNECFHPKYSKLKKIGKKLTGKFTTPKVQSTKHDLKNKTQKTKSKKNIPRNSQFKRDLNKSVTVNGKTAYGISERLSEQMKFGNKYCIKENELTLDESKFIKLYSDDGFSSLNTYMRKVKGVLNPIKRWKLKRYWSNQWDMAMKSNENYMPMDKAIKVGKNLFKKGKILENDLVVVRRQKGPLLNHAKNGVYRNDAFLSTSISENILEYGPYKNFIRIPKGEKIIYIECLTSAEREFEVILAPGVTFKSVESINSKFHKWSM